jgi:transposase, IS5 family
MALRHEGAHRGGADSRLVQAVGGTAANVNGASQAGALLHGEDKVAFGDAGYRSPEQA